MLTKFIQWYKGYLKIKLIGYSPERFINICKSKNIYVWDLKSCNNHYELCIFIKDFKKLKPLCKKTVSKVRVIEKVGLPFFLNRMSKRKAYVLGMLITSILIYLSSFHLWNIEVSGNKKITEDVVMTFLSDEKIQLGMPLNKINYESIVTNMRNHFQEIIWVSVSLEGTSLHIELRENTDTLTAATVEESPANLIAKYDGIITHMVTRNGIPVVKEGDTVKKGDILVSGMIPVLNDNKEIVRTNYVKADADIIGERSFSYQEKIETQYRNKEYIKESIYFHLGPFQNTPKTKDDKEIFIEHNLLKTGAIKTYKWTDLKLTAAERESILTKNFLKFCEQLSNEEIKVLESNLQIHHYEDYSIATNTLRLEQAMEESLKIIDLSSDNMLQ